jgi:hypothetical protein
LVLVAATGTDVMGSQSNDHFDSSEFSRKKLSIHVQNCFKIIVSNTQ